MAVEHGLPEVGSPSTEDPDPGTQHLYGTIWEIGAAAVLQQNHAFNRVWYAPSTPSTSDELGWAVWDEAGAALVASVTLASPGATLTHGWNPVGDLGSPVDLAVGSYVVFGRWVGKSPYDLSFAFPADGSAGPTGHITLSGGTFGFGALGNPRAGGGGDFDLRAWADAALSFGGTVVQASGASSLVVDLAGAAVRVSAAGGASPVTVDMAGAGARVSTAAGALGLAVTAVGQPRVVRTAAGVLAVTVGLTGTPRGQRARPGIVVAGDVVAAGVVAGQGSGSGIVPA